MLNMVMLWLIPCQFLFFGCSPLSRTVVESTGPTLLWHDATETTIGKTAEWTNKVELADVNGDGLVDILFANGGKYEAPGDPEFCRIFLNQGPNKLFKEATRDVVGNEPALTRVIKVQDLDQDGHPDIVMGTNYSTQSRLLLGDGKGNYHNVTTSHLPKVLASVGDLEFGDVDGDGDLDMLLADWGPGNPMKNMGGRTMLWLNDGRGHFTDVTARQMPDVLVKFCWDLEFVDADNDYDLDILISSKKSDGSFFYLNDGNGAFRDVTQDRLPQFTNNYEFEAMDMNGDSFLDLVTINDGDLVEGGNKYHRREHIFMNDAGKRFLDITAEWWPDSENMGYDDNLALYLDFDSDGDPDILVGSLDGPDRLLINDGRGYLKVANEVFGGKKTSGTLGMAVADLNNDGKLDVVQGQGEIKGSIDERVFLGMSIAPDRAPPVITMVEKLNSATSKEKVRIRARVHDHKSPIKPHDWKSVVLQWKGEDGIHANQMNWYGEYLWFGCFTPALAGLVEYRVCAEDFAGNRTCSAWEQLTITPKK